MHAVISLLLQSRKFGLLTSLMLLYDVIMTPYCCQRYAECLVTTLCSSRTAHENTPVELLRQETPNFLASKLCPQNSPDLNPVDYEIWAVM